MTAPEVFAQLVDVFVRFYSEERDARRLAQRVELETGEVEFRGRARPTWEDVLHEAIQSGQMDHLLAVVAAERVDNQVMQQAIDAWRDLSPEQQASLIHIPSTRSVYSRRADFYAHISLPPNFVPRPELLAEVREVLLSDSGTLALTSSVKMDALHGMGGMGKSVLARALCDDPQVQSAFPGGILWASIGRTPDLVARLSEWIRALGGVISETAPTADWLKATLARLMRERTCLLILDDVWLKDHVEYFRVGGPGCQLLLTTRNAAIVRDLGGHPHPVPLMMENEAVNLLEVWAGDSLRSTDPQLKLEIVRRLQRLPLAIKLAGAQLQSHDPELWLKAFSATELESEEPQTVNDSLTATFALSLDDLLPTDRRAYSALAIFRESEPVPAVAAIRLWTQWDGRSSRDARVLLDRLAARALVQGTGPNGVAGDAVTIHDLLRDFMLAELGQDRLLAAHRALVDAYRATQQGHGWHTAPDDGYLYDHLVYHLDQVAGLDPTSSREICALFASRDWLQARLERCYKESDRYLYDGYLADLTAAWHEAYTAASQQMAAGEEASAFGDCVRYALIRTSINSLAANYVPELVAQAIEQQLDAWPPRRGLSLAPRIPDPELRCRMYVVLLKLSHLSSAECDEAAGEGLAAARAINDEGTRVQALVALAPQLTGELHEAALREGLVAARAIKNEETRVEALAALAPQLTGARRKAALREGLAAAQAIDDEETSAQALIELAPQLTGVLLVQGLAAARAIKDAGHRVEAVAALAPNLAGVARQRAVAQGLDWVWSIEDDESRADALAALAPNLAGDFLTGGLAAAEFFRHDEYRLRALAALVRQLPGAERETALREGLAAAQAIEDGEARAEALAALLPHLTGELLTQGLAAARAMSDDRHRALALAALAPQLTGELHEAALREGLAAAQAIDYELFRAQPLAALAPHLTGTLLAQGLAAAQAIGDEKARPHVLAALAPQLTDNLLAQGLAGAQTISDKEDRVRALAGLALQLTGATRVGALEHGLSVALTISHESYRAGALAALAPQLTDQLLTQGLAAAQAMSSEWHRAWALAALAPQLTGARREAALREGLTAALAIEHGRGRASALAALAPHLAGELLAQALAAALATWGWVNQVEALAALAPHLTGDLLAQGLARVPSIRDELLRVRVLRKLAPRLTGDLLVQGLAAAQALRDVEYRAWALAALAPQLTGAARDEALRQGLAAVDAIWDQGPRVRALAGFAPQLTGDFLTQGLALLQGVDDEGLLAKGLVALAPQLTGEAHDEALAHGLAAAQAIDDEWPRAHALAELAPQLTGALRTSGLIATQSIKSEEPRLRALAAFVRYADGADAAIPLVRRAMVDHLYRSLSQRSRADLLRFCTNGDLFRLPIFSQASLAAIANHIIDICQWEWL